MAADARRKRVKHCHNKRAGGCKTGLVCGRPRNRGLADQELDSGKRAARAAADGRSVLMRHRPRHHRIHAAVVSTLHVPIGAAMRVVVLVEVTVLRRTANGGTGRTRVRDRIAVLDARLRRIGHRHRELARVDVADRVGGVPSDGGGTDIELLTVQRRVGTVNGRRLAHHLVVQRGNRTAVVRGRGIPYLFRLVVGMITLASIVVFRLVPCNSTGNLRRGHILHHHVEGTGGFVARLVRGRPRHRRGAVAELLARHGCIMRG